MKKQLTTNGNSWHLYIKKPIAQLMGITPDEYTVIINVENKTLYVRKIKNNELEQVKDLMHKKLLKRGSGYGLSIQVALLELLEINPEKDMVEFEINGQTLTIKKAE
ncbi:hypothetical protein J6E39_04360 [bacterium]|nr:hypothetical protein [bacterium]